MAGKDKVLYIRVDSSRHEKLKQYCKLHKISLNKAASKWIDSLPDIQPKSPRKN